MRLKVVDSGEKWRERRANSMLCGQYFHNIDEKGRMNFPSKLRDELGERFYLTRWLDDCLVVFSEDEWQNICERLKTQSMARSRDIQRFLFSNAVTVEPDKQGRILIPSNLREDAGLVKDVVVIGVMNKAEIWDKERWTRMNESIDVKEIDDKMFELGI